MLALLKPLFLFPRAVGDVTPRVNRTLFTEAKVLYLVVMPCSLYSLLTQCYECGRSTFTNECAIPDVYIISMVILFLILICICNRRTWRARSI